MSLFLGDGHNFEVILLPDDFENVSRVPRGLALASSAAATVTLVGQANRQSTSIPRLSSPRRPTCLHSAVPATLSPPQPASVIVCCYCRNDARSHGPLHICSARALKRQLQARTPSRTPPQTSTSHRLVRCTCCRQQRSGSCAKASSRHARTRSSSKVEPRNLDSRPRPRLARRPWVDISGCSLRGAAPLDRARGVTEAQGWPQLAREASTNPHARCRGMSSGFPSTRHPHPHGRRWENLPLPGAHGPQQCTSRRPR